MLLRIFDGPFYGPAETNFEPQEIRCESFENSSQGIAELLIYATPFQEDYLCTVDFEDAPLDVRVALAPEIFSRQIRWILSESKKICLYDADVCTRWIFGDLKNPMISVNPKGEAYHVPNCVLKEDGGISISTLSVTEAVDNIKQILKVCIRKPFKLFFITQDTYYFVARNEFTTSSDTTIVRADWL